MIKVGQRVFIVEKTYRHNAVPAMGYYEVTKVGRKYFYVMKNRWEVKFNIETMREDNNGNYKDSAYLCQMDYENELKKDSLRKNIEHIVRGYGWYKDMPLDKMELIHNILKEHE